MLVPQKPSADVNLRRGDTVAFEIGGVCFPAILYDDEVENPIRKIRVGADVRSEFADELTPVDEETFEMLIVLRLSGVSVDVSSAV